MFIVIDREHLVVLYKHDNQAALVSLANIEVPEAAIVAMGATDPDSYARFTDFELKVLFENISGEKYSGYDRTLLKKAVIGKVEQLPVTQLRSLEVEAQLNLCTD